MADYDFKQLSSYDFEILVRDLLQKELNLTLESFKTGRDKGIDLRYSCNENNTIIVQCKHYANSTFSDLQNAIRGEKEKIKKLNCKRYILVTSLGLTPPNKDILKSILEPYCISASDIFGKDDINNLLTKHSEIEKNHFKLWLTSTTIMDRILHSSLYNQSDIELDSIKNKIKFYVQNKSYFKALDILNKVNYCIITGIPGIGKTTLAEILILHYLEKGFEIYKITNSINEAFEMYKPSKLQLFYYDDFLGQTSFEEKLNKNEDAQILKFIEWTRKNKNTKFILTTREYILNQAKLIYEKLDNSNFDINRCTIKLEDYTRVDKAKILFNHIYFSNLPIKNKEEIIDNRRYMRIINHPNYNPRLIEWMTISYREGICNDYFNEFINLLNNPYKLWEHIFENQLHSYSRDLLLILATLPNGVYIDELKESFEAFHKHKAKLYGSQIKDNDFRNALKELDGNFISNQKFREKIFISFNNPSIRDFIEGYILNDNDNLKILITCVIYFDQIKKLLSLIANKCNINLRLYENVMIEAIDRCFESIELSSLNNSGIIKYTNTLLERLYLIINLLIKLKLSSLNLIQKLFLKVFDNIDYFELDDFLSLIKLMKKTEYKQLISNNFISNRIMNIIMLNYPYKELYGFDIIRKFYECYPNALTQVDLDNIRNYFINFYKNDIDYMIESTETYDELDDYKEKLKDIGDFLSINLKTELETLEKEIEEKKKNEMKEPDFDYNIDNYEKVMNDRLEEKMIDEMFESMLEK
ncbi:MAG: hypothetical protein PWQ23_760 [Thermoanaerobacter sp.]|nr:hypothetical protein [Thermoanaerobacter sp.]